MRRMLPAGHGGRQSRGQSLVEFALILPILAVLLLGVLDAGRLFMSWITLNNEVRVAANYAALNPTDVQLADYADAVNLEGAGLNCALQPDASGNNPPAPIFPSGTGVGNPAIATMSCKFNLWTPLMSSLFGGPLTLSSSAQFPIRTGAIANLTGSTTLPPPGPPLAAFSFVNVSGGTVDASGNVTGTGSVTVNLLDQSSNAQKYVWTITGTASATCDATHPDLCTNQPNALTYGAGTYTVTLTVTNTAGPPSSASKTITVTPKVTPVAAFCGTVTSGGYSGGSGGCATNSPILGTINPPNPLSVSFVNNSTGGSTFLWDFGDGSPTSTAQSPTYTYSTYGIFTVTLTITSPTGANPSSISGYVTTGCVVPVYGTNQSTANAASTWSAAGFTGQITYLQAGSKNASNKPPSPPGTITTQSLQGGLFEVPTDVTTGNNKGWQCNNDIQLTYTYNP
jgi:PKD repeat protein/Flp pilus assembly protein TadG